MTVKLIMVREYIRQNDGTLLGYAISQISWHGGAFVALRGRS
jgi:hypothetical protein